MNNLANELRQDAEDLYSAVGYNKTSTLLSKAADEIERLEREAVHWKANHDNQVRIARILKERTDMPVERVAAFNEWQKDRRELDKLRVMAWNFCRKPTPEELGETK